jgi:hypothetical protein
LQVRKRLKRRVAIGRGDLAAAAVSMNERWSLDFVHDTLETGRRIRTLNIVDDFTRACLAIEVDTSLSGQRVARVLDAIGSVRGFPQTIVMDNELRERVKGASTIGRASTSVRGRSAWPSELPAKSDSLTMVTQGLYEPSMSFKQRVGPSGRSEHYLRGQACLNGTERRDSPAGIAA